MSTPTCSTFLPRKCLTPYLEEKYLLAANGPYLELFDLNELREKDVNSEYVPVKTRVTANSTIYHILPLDKSGHVMVISSEVRRKCRTLFLHIVHSDLIKTGGYVRIDASTSYVLSREENFKGNSPSDTRSELIKGKKEFILATSTFIARFAYNLSSSEGFHDADIVELAKFDLRSILPQHLSSECILSPLCISPTLPLKFMLHTSIFNNSAQRLVSLFVFHIIDSSPTYQQLLNDKSKVQVMLSSLNVGILCGDEYISMISTSSASQHKGEPKEIDSTLNPFRSPIKIEAWEDVKAKKATFIVFSNLGISVWTINGKMLNMQYTIDDPHAKKYKVLETPQDFQPILVSQIEHLTHVNGILDATIVNDPKGKLESFNLLISRRGGGLQMITANEDKESTLLFTFLINSTLCSCSKTPSTNFKNVYVFNDNCLLDFSATVISVDSLAAERLTLNKNGQLSLISRENLDRTELTVYKPFCSDVKYDPVVNIAYIILGTESGEVYLRILDQSNAPKYDDLIHTEESKILSICFYGNQFEKNSSNYYAILTISTLKFIRLEYNERIGTETCLHDTTVARSIDISKIKKMLIMGDGEKVHDIWLISDTAVYLIIGRNQEYKKKLVELQFTDWKGSISASCSLSTKKSVYEDYLDVIFVAKGPKIGILVVLHMEDDPANVIQFTEWKMSKGSDAIAIHTELIKYEVTNDVHNLDIRLYAMKRKSGTLHISVCRLVVDGSGVSVSKQTRRSKFTIPTSIRNPHHIVVTNIPRIDAKPNTEPPKFVIVSGSNGSQVVRICPNKQLYSKDLDKIVSSSSVDQEHLSDGE